MFTFLRILLCVAALIILGPLALVLFVVGVAATAIVGTMASSSNIMYADYAVRRLNKYYKNI